MKRKRELQEEDSEESNKPKRSKQDIKVELAHRREVKLGTVSKEEVAVRIVPHQEVMRAPMDLVVVLDCSSSMEGEAIKACRESMENIIGSMGALDCLSLVTYADDAETVFGRGTPKRDMLRDVSKIIAYGNTNIGAGICLAVKILTSSFSTEKPPPENKRIFLLSDGEVNKGLKGPELKELVRDVHKSSHKINITTFGFNIGYDVDLMESIATLSGSNHYFIDKVASVEPKISKSFERLGMLVAKNAKLEIKGAANFHVFGGSTDIGDLFGGYQKHKLLEVLVDASSSAEGDVLNPIECVLTYDRVSPFGDLVPMQTLVKRVEMTATHLPILTVSEHLEVVSEVVKGGERQRQVEGFIGEEKLDEAEKLQRELLEKAELLVSKYPWNKMAENTLRIYEKVLSHIEEAQRSGIYEDTQTARIMSSQASQVFYNGDEASCETMTM